MSEIIETNTIGRGIAETTPVVLEGTANIRLVFYPMVHEGGVRGKLVRYKKTTQQKWSDLSLSDFEKQVLKSGEFFELELKTNALEKFVEEIEKRKEIVSDGVAYGSHEYLTIEKNRVLIIDDNNKKQILEQILEKGYTDDYWSLIKESMPEVANKLVNSQVQESKREIIYEFQARLSKGGYSETTGDDSWQRWLYKNNWLFGVNYKKPIEKAKINVVGIMPDYLFPTIDGFVDLLEIKLPSYDVIMEDTSHAGSWRWSSDSNKAIGQVVNYLNEIERLRLEIEKDIKVKYGYDLMLLKPRAYILIGDSSAWGNDQKEGLRKLNHALHGIEILTYSDLVSRGSQFTDIEIIS